MTSFLKSSSNIPNAATRNASSSSSLSYSSKENNAKTEDRKKRTRPVSACENCRSKKVKCHLLPDRPICKGCAQSGKECLFRVDDLSPALRRERFPDYVVPVNQNETNSVQNRRRRRKSSTAEEITAKEEEEGEGDEPEGKLKKGNDGRPIKTKAIFRSFANPTKLAAPSTSKISVITRPSSNSNTDARNDYAQFPIDTGRVNVQNNGGIHPPPVAPATAVVNQNGELNNNAWYPYPANHAGYEQNRLGPQNGQFRSPTYRSAAQRNLSTQQQQQQNAYLPTNGGISQQQKQFYHNPIAVPTTNAPAYGNAYNTSERNGAGGAHAYPNSSTLRDYVHRRSIGSPPGSELSEFRANNSSLRTQPAGTGAYATEQLPPPKSAVSPSPFAWSPNNYTNQSLFNANSPKRSSVWSIAQRPTLSSSHSNGENSWQNNQHISDSRIPVQKTSSPRPRQSASLSASSHDGLNDPNVPRNDLALASQLQRETDGEEDEKIDEESTIEQSESHQSSSKRKRINVKLEFQQQSQNSLTDNNGETPSSGTTSSRPPATFKKIALPFFRWFGATANTPGIRRIKIGVYHEADMDLAGVGEVEENKEDEEEQEGMLEEEGDEEIVRQTSTSAITKANLKAFSPVTVINNLPKPPISTRSPAQGSITSITHPSPNLVQTVDKANPSIHSQSHSHHPPQQQQQNRAESAISTTVRELFEIDRPRYPRRDILLHLVNLFIKYFKASCFPWLDEKELVANAKSGELPAILANSICSMTSRFSGHPDLKRVKNASESFADMAKVLVVPMLSWPSIDVIEALVILSYAEFGAGADAGLWMYVGMALRMATDLGLQHELTIRSMATIKQQERARYLFWAIVSLDRITCFGTGRPVTVRDDAYDCELPALDNDPASDGFVFGHIVRTLIKRGQIGELLNRREDGLTLEQRGAQLRALWLDLAEYYESLPAELHFGVNTFRKLAAADKGCAFVYLHILLQSTISLLNRPSLLRRFDRDFSMTAPSRLASIANHAAGTIVSILRFATDAGQHRTRSQEENEDVNPYIDCNPYLDQLILPTGRAFLSESESTKEILRNLGHSASQSRPMTANGDSLSNEAEVEMTKTSDIPTETTVPQPSQTTQEGGMNSTNDIVIEGLKTRRQYAQINLSTCQQVLDRVAKWWSGASWPARALRQECEGVIDSEIGPDGTDEEAQPAPIRDVEMVLKWARARRVRAQNAPATPSRRNSVIFVGNQAGIGGEQVDENGNILDSLGEMEDSIGVEGGKIPGNIGGAQFDPSSNFSGWHGESPLGLGFSGSLGADAEINMDSLINAWAIELGSIESTAAIQGGVTAMSTGFAQGGGNGGGENQSQNIGFGGRTGYTPIGTPAAMTSLRNLGRSRPASRANHRGYATDTNTGNPQLATSSDYISQIPSNQNHHHPQSISQDLTTWNYGFPGPMDMNLSAMQLEEFFFSPPAGMIESQPQQSSSLTQQHNVSTHQHEGQGGDISLEHASSSSATGQSHGGNVLPYDTSAGVNVIGQMQAPSTTPHGLANHHSIHSHQQQPHHHHPQPHAPHTHHHHQNPDNTGIVIQQNLDILPPALFNAFNFHPAPSPSIPPATPNRKE